MDETLRDAITEKLEEINNIHPSLKFTHKEENENSIAFLDMQFSKTAHFLNQKISNT